MRAALPHSRGYRCLEFVMATCPECEFDEIDTEDFEDGDLLSCPECGKNLVVAGGDVDLADDDEDDDLDDDEDDEEEEDGFDEDAVEDEDEDEEEDVEE
jgi:hypothetical protein